MHLLFSQLDRFYENLGAVSDKQAERFRQEVSAMEAGCQSFRDLCMLSILAHTHV